MFELDKKGMLVVTRYMLEEGKESYCEAQKMTVTTYRLVDGNEDFVAPYYLKKVGEKKLLKKYESVEGFIR